MSVLGDERRDGWLREVAPERTRLGKEGDRTLIERADPDDGRGFMALLAGIVVGAGCGVFWRETIGWLLRQGKG